jgi:hypothetical protein
LDIQNGTRGKLDDKKSNKRYHYEQHHHVDEPSGNEVQHTSLPQRVRQLCHKIRRKGGGDGDVHG